MAYVDQIHLAFQRQAIAVKSRGLMIIALLRKPPYKEEENAFRDGP
jgi:hypothetical protein